jgi:hypothetical protein
MDWTPVRLAYIDRAERPTYAELSTEFSIPESSVKRIAADEGWPLMRARRLELAMQQSDAATVLIEAARGEREVLESFRAVALVMLRDTLANIEQVRSEGKPARRLALIQTASFALQNLSQALKNVGFIGIPKGLQDRLKDREERGDGWRSGMAMLNVLIQNGPSAAVSVAAAPTGRGTHPPTPPA